jgi:hypothetical protein
LVPRRMNVIEPLTRTIRLIRIPPLFRGEMSAFSGDGALHQENQKGEYHGSYRKNQERVEIGKSRGLLFAKILKRL